MTVLNPWFLAAAAAIGIPVFLHLFQKRKTVRLSFPALRYLERTEREHAQEIRLRQILLLLARIGALALLVLAGARPLIRGPGSAHPPTAVVIVLDNSLSSGLVLGEDRVLDVLKRVADAALDGATPEDRFWVVRAGEPWLPAIPGGAAEARAAIQATETSASAGDLTSALRRASELLATAPESAREIHLVSDLQATAFDRTDTRPAGTMPVVVWSGLADPGENRGIVSLLVGSGLAPVQGQRADLSVRLSGSASEDSTTMVGLRALVDGRIRAAATIPPGSEATLPLPPTGPGWVVGSVEADPDALALDDRRFFAFRSRSAPAVVISGEPGRFVREAFAVLEDAGRMRRGSIDSGDVILAVGGTGLSAPGIRPVVLIPPADPTLLPALNLRLQAAGVPWSYRAREASGGADLSGANLPPGLDGIRTERWYVVTPEEGAQAPSRVLAETGGTPWVLETRTAAGGPLLLLASPLDAASSTLPVSAGLIRFLDWTVGEWAGSGGSGTGRIAGDPLPAPAGATHVTLPDGTNREVDGTRSVRNTGAAGPYTFLAGDSVLAVVAVNPPPQESDLARLERAEVEAAVGTEVTVASSDGAWTRAVFRQRTGPEIWWPLLLTAALLLLLESRLAAAGRPTAPTAPSRSVPSPEPAAHGAS